MELESKSNGICAITCSHQLAHTAVCSSVIIFRDYVEIRCLNHRTYATYSHKLGLCHVASMYTRNIGNAENFWKSLARSIERVKVVPSDGSSSGSDEDNNVVYQFVANTQHIAFYNTVKSSKGEPAYLLYQVMSIPFLFACLFKVFDMKTFQTLTPKGYDTWEIDFLSVIKEPFLLEISIRSSAPTNNR